MTRLFERKNKKIPVWFMRQAGRYHRHYQDLKKINTFMDLCKNPDLATEVTLGPIRDFHFDGAILFSDLLFPLEHLNMGLSYDQGPPALSWHLHDLASMQKNLTATTSPNIFYDFQAQACAKLRQQLPPQVTLLGFSGAPFTLFAYAVEGGHHGNLVDTKKGLYDGRYQAFLERLLPSLTTQLSMQLSAGADAVCLFDTAAGELSFECYLEFVVSVLSPLVSELKKRHPSKKIIYYARNTSLDYFLALENISIDVIGIDWRVNLKDALNHLGSKYYVQGNLDPALLHLPWEHLKSHLIKMLQKVNNPDRYIAGLGHGVLPKTPEENVKNAVEFIQNWQG